MEAGTPRRDTRDEDPTRLVRRAPEDGDEAQALPDEDRTKSIRNNDGFELVAGTFLGEYQIERMIGEGGMGIVYAAVHPIIGKRVAVKVLQKELCSDPDAIQRFVDEARAVNHIGHPNIVDIFAFGEISGRSYLAMEWLQGESLRECVDRGPLTVSEVCAVLRPLALALEAAHAKNVIHRDLKPDNVFLTAVDGEPPRVKLLDFGLAKLGHADPGVTRTAVGAMLGTPQYIAPEQAKGQEIDHRVDIYALGVVAFELLAGRPPFVADNSMEMVAKHLMEPPPRIANHADVPRELDDLVDAMLSKDAERRPSLAQISTVLARCAVQPASRPQPVIAATATPAVAIDPRLPAETATHVAHTRRPPGRLIVWGGAVVIAVSVVAALTVGSLGVDELVIEAGSNDPAAMETEPPPTNTSVPSKAADDQPDIADAPVPTVPPVASPPSSTSRGVPGAAANASGEPRRVTADRKLTESRPAAPGEAPPVAQAPKRAPPSSASRGVADAAANASGGPRRVKVDRKPIKPRPPAKVRKVPTPAPPREASPEVQEPKRPPPIEKLPDGLVAPGAFGGGR